MRARPLTAALSTDAGHSSQRQPPIWSRRYRLAGGLNSSMHLDHAATVASAPRVRQAAASQPTPDQAARADKAWASAAARCMLEDISLVTVLCSSTAAAVEVTYSLTLTIAC